MWKEKKQAPVALIKQKEGGKAVRTTYEKSDHVQENANAQAKRSLKANRKTHFGPRAREILAYAHI